jgi:hypothetical protein
MEVIRSYRLIAPAMLLMFFSIPPLEAAVYDLKGACVYQGTLTSRRIDLAAEKCAGSKSYVVKIGETRYYLLNSRLKSEEL